MPEGAEEPPEGRPMTFWEHTEELTRRLKIVVYTFAVSTVIMMVLPANLSFFNNPFAFYQPLVAVILKTMRNQILPANVRIIGLELVAPIELYILASFVFGLAITTPVFAYEIFKFIDPALYPHERRDIYPFLTSFLALFIVGLIFGYFVLTPSIIRATLPFFSAVGAEMTISVMDFYYLLFVTTLMTGLTFTFPVFLVLLVKYGIIGTSLLTRNRMYLYAAIFIFVCIVTPDGGLANFILFIPMIALLESGIFFAKRYEKQGVPRRRISLFPQREEIKCRFCGNSIPPGTTFCPYCGKSQK